MKSPGINYLVGLGLSGDRGKSQTNGETRSRVWFLPTQQC
jgi:hypothetical protein